MAKTFDRWLPYIQPVAEALISLADISPGDKVLDVASGTGEPALTLARRFGGTVELVGVDGAEAMVAVANDKVRREALKGIRFLEMKAEKLSFEADRFDRVISRFGVMLFDNPLAGMKEMRRVLKPGGTLAIAVWGEFHNIPSLYLIWERLMALLPPEGRLPTPRMADLGPPGKLEALLRTAGFDRYKIEPFGLTYTFDDFEIYWNVSTESGVLKDPLERLTPARREALKTDVRRQLDSHRKNNVIQLTNQALLAAAVK